MIAPEILESAHRNEVTNTRLYGKGSRISMDFGKLYRLYMSIAC